MEAIIKRGFFQSLFGSAALPEVFQMVKGEAINQYAQRAKDTNGVWNVNFENFIRTDVQGKIIYRDRRLRAVNASLKNIAATSTSQQKQAKIEPTAHTPVDTNSNKSEFTCKVVNTKQDIIQAAKDVIAKNKDVPSVTGVVLPSRLEDILSYAPSSVSFRNTKVKLYNLHSLYITCSSNELRWNLTIDTSGFAYSIFDIDYFGESRFRKGSLGISPTEEYSADNICKFYSALTGMTIRPKTERYKPKPEMAPETIAQYNKVKELCKKLNIDYTTSMTIKEVLFQRLMKFQTLNTIMGLTYKNPNAPQISLLCKEVGIKWEGEPSEAFFKQFWDKTATCDQIDKEIKVLSELLQKQIS